MVRSYQSEAFRGTYDTLRSLSKARNRLAKKFQYSPAARFSYALNRSNHSSGPSRLPLDRDDLRPLTFDFRLRVSRAEHHLSSKPTINRMSILQRSPEESPHHLCADRTRQNSRRSKNRAAQPARRPCPKKSCRLPGSHVRVRQAPYAPRHQCDLPSPHHIPQRYVSRTARLPAPPEC